MRRQAITLQYDKNFEEWVVSRGEVIRCEEDYDNAREIAETHSRIHGLPICEEGEGVSQ
jgi:hypothetical protein